MKGLVYIITNTINGNSYIGQTSRGLDVRLKDHATGKGSPYLGNAIAKYGIENFNKEILYQSNDENALNKAEFDLVKAYGTLYPQGYNLRDGGRVSKMTEEAKKKLSIALTGKKQSIETKAKRSKSLTGKIKPDYERKRSSEAQKGKPKNYSSEILLKMRLAKLGKKQSPTLIAKRVAKMIGHHRTPKRPVIRTCIKTGIEWKYPGAINTSIDGFHPSHVAQCCQGKVRQHGGHYWRYLWP